MNSFPSAMFTVDFAATGCYSSVNPSRAENGERGETETYDTLREAVEALRPYRSAEIYDRYGNMVVRVRVSGRGAEAVAPNGTWGPIPINDVDAIIGATE